jgi:membrane protein
VSSASTERMRAAEAPDPDDERKPDAPSDISKRSWLYVARKTAREFSSDQCTDLAASLTYYAVLALFPGFIALVSLIGVFGQGKRTTDALLQIASSVAPSSAVDSLRPTLERLSSTSGAGLALVLGLAGALWSASGYVGAFGRAMNRVYEIGEGRPIWKLRPVILVVTAVSIVLCAVALILIVVTGPIATELGKQLGLGSSFVLVWDIAKWPVLLGIVVLDVAMLYYFTPNVKQPKFRWITIGALVAIVTWIVASVAFGFYVANFSSYDKTYGSLAGVVVFLLWLWITNLALLFGAELDAEVERGRELQGGLAAEQTIQLPARDTRKIEKTEAKEEDDIEQGREIRQAAADGQRSHSRDG